jgi:predicted secreted hydrolase
LRLHAPALAAALTAGCIDPAMLCPDALYETSQSAPGVRLPRDEAPHCYGGVEWWYYTGRLMADDGSAYGIHAVVFHLPREPLIHLTDVWAAHYAVLDVDQGNFAYDQTAILGPSPDRSTADRGFEVDARIVQLRGLDGADELNAAFEDQRFALALTLNDRGGAVPHRGSGYAPYGSEAWSFYYSRPKMAATGTLRIGGSTKQVTGDFWFDRQWGLALNNPLQPWDWFSIRLDDGRRFMLYLFPGETSLLALGTYVPMSGSPAELSGEDFTITPRSTWTSPRTGDAYDVAWTIDFPLQGLELEVVAVQADQELDARRTTLNTYWEGLCAVNGQERGVAVTGYAYVEQANGGAE